MKLTERRIYQRGVEENLIHFHCFTELGTHKYKIEAKNIALFVQL
jgi:hypothetical protein